MDRILEAMGELGAAITQSSPTDDQIIMDHVRRAHALIEQEWRDRQESARPHYHQAHYIGERLTDTCGLCGHDLRHEIHKREPRNEHVHPALRVALEGMQPR
jgi:hypothetical protein